MSNNKQNSSNETLITISTDDLGRAQGGWGGPALSAIGIGAGIWYAGHSKGLKKDDGKASQSYKDVFDPKNKANYGYLIPGVGPTYAAARFLYKSGEGTGRGK